MKPLLARPTLALSLLALAASAAPRATLQHTPPGQAKPGEQLRIDGTLANGSSVDRVVLKYRGPGEEYVESRMELQYGDLFRGYVPASQMVPPGVEYYVEGVTFTGERVALFASAGKPARVLVLGQLEKPPPAPRKETPQEDPKPRAGPVPPGEEPPRSELEEELALYSAEDTVALATRHEEKVTRVPAIASSFNREQIRALGARTVYDVLDVVPGLSVSRDVQGFHRTAIRGLRSDPEVLFLLNGHRLNSFFDGKALANLPVENIERIEVIRGPGSALHGAGAFLGVVNIKTSREEGFRAAASGGMGDALGAHASGAKRLGAVELFADADFVQQRGYQKPISKDAHDKDTIFQKMRGPLDPAGLTNDRRRLLSVGGGLSYELGGAGKLGLSARLLDEDRGALVGLFDAVGPASNLSWRVLQLDGGYERNWGAAGVRVRAYFDDQSTRRLFQLTPPEFKLTSGVTFPDGLLERSDVGVRTFGLEAGADVELFERNRLSLGAVAESESLRSYAYETNYTAAGELTEFTRPEGLLYPQEIGSGAAASRLTLGAFAQDQWTVVDRVTLTLGLRLDAQTVPFIGPGDEIIGTALVLALNPRVGAVFAVSDSLVLKLLYGRAFRAPTVQELAERIPNTDYNQGRFQGNPRLLPASANTFELGADLVQAAGEARVRLRGNAFYELLSSPIAPVDTSGNIIPLLNRDEGVSVVGLEGEARLEASSRASAWINASWFRAMDLETPSEFWLLTDTPQARFNAGVSMPLGELLNFDVIVRVGAERRNNSRSVLELVRRWRIPAYSLITAQLRTEPIAGHFEIALTGHNVFDHDHLDDVPRADRMPGLLPREGLSGTLTVRANY